MKAYELKPTYENLLNTYIENSIDRNGDIFRFIEVLDSIEDSCSIAVDGNWGSGKTFFVKQVKMVIDAHNQFVKAYKEEDRKEIVSIRQKYFGSKVHDLNPQVCVYYDAWENDNEEEPVMSLVYEIIQSVNADFSFHKTDWIKLGASIIDNFTGMKWTQVVENLRKKSPFKELKAHKDIKKLVDDFLVSLLEEKGDRLTIFIDELDRCKPSYAVRLLERIKHYFVHDQITFVFSINTNQLHHTIKKYYGSGFDGSRYLNRFFDLRISLPAPNMRKFYDSLNFNERLWGYDLVCDAVIKTYRFELREIAKFLRLTKSAAYDVMHEKQRVSMSDGEAVEYCLCLIVPVMIGLMTTDINRYSDFILGKDSEPLLEVLEHLDMLGFEKLLAPNETYYEDGVNKVHVTRKEKLTNLYHAVFSEKTNESQRAIQIGYLNIYDHVKTKLLRISGMLSEYAKFDYDLEGE